jgi:hypothetical protein
MCRILFIIHLIILGLVELFVCRKYGKNRPKWWQTWTKEASGRGRATWAHRSALLGHRLAPQVAMPHHQSVGAAPKLITSLHSRRFVQRTKFVHGGSMGPLSWTWEPPLTYQLPYLPNFTMCWFTTDLEEQARRYDAMAMDPRADRCPPCAAWCPRSSTDLATAYKYPSPHYTL